MKNTTIKIHHSLRSAERLRKELRDQRIALEAMLKKLERQGVWWGTLHRQEKRPDYFVWYFHGASRMSKGGKRVRIYIGAGSERSPAVLDVKRRIRRGEEHDKLSRKLRAVVAATDDFADLLLAAVEAGKVGQVKW